MTKPTMRFWFFAMLLAPIYQVTATDHHPQYGPDYHLYAGLPVWVGLEHAKGPQSRESYRTDWAPAVFRKLPVAYGPKLHHHYPGYKFRPWQQSPRYRPNFNQQKVSRQAMNYRWRPFDSTQQRPAWRNPRNSQNRNPYYPGRQTHPAYLPPYAERLAVRQATPYWQGYRSNPSLNRKHDIGNPSVYRSTAIKIPNHYVFRPINPNRALAQRHRYTDKMHSGVSESSSVGNIEAVERYRFRPITQARQTQLARSGSAPRAVWRPAETAHTELSGRRYYSPSRADLRQGGEHTGPRYAFRQPRHFTTVRFRNPSVAGYQNARGFERFNNHRNTPHAYRNQPLYPLSRAQQRYPVQAPQRAFNSYDGVPDSVGAWYVSESLGEWPMVSHSPNMEYYPSLDFDGVIY